MKRVLFPWIFSTVIASGALAQVQDCSKALVKANLSASSSEVERLALAFSLSENAYNESKHNVGAHGVIYGVPVGADYGEFHQNANTKAQSLGIDNFRARSYAYATSGLDANSLQAYKDCLLSNGGLSLVVGAKGANSYVLWIVYTPPLNANPRLSGRLISTENLTAASRNSIASEMAGRDFGRVNEQLNVRVEDPNAESVATVGVGSQSVALLVPPLTPIRTTTECKANSTIRDFVEPITQRVLNGERGSPDLDRTEWQPFLYWVRHSMDSERCLTPKVVSAVHHFLWVYNGIPALCNQGLIYEAERLVSNCISRGECSDSQFSNLRQSCPKAFPP